MTRIKQFFFSRDNLEYLIGGVIFIVFSIILIYSTAMRESDTTISIDNTQMYDAVVDSMNDQVITLEEASDVTSLVIADHKGLDNLEDLEEFTDLEVLTIRNCTMDSLDGIENFRHLRKVSVSATLDANAIQNINLWNLRDFPIPLHA